MPAHQPVSLCDSFAGATNSLLGSDGGLYSKAKTTMFLLDKISVYERRLSIASLLFALYGHDLMLSFNIGNIIVTVTSYVSR